MEELIKEILSHKNEDGVIGELANELYNIIEDHKAGHITDEDLKELLTETINAFKAHENANNEVMFRWAVKIAQLAAKAMI